MCKNCVKCGDHLDQTRSGQGICEICEAHEAANDAAYEEYLHLDPAPLDDEPCECVHDMPGHHRCCPHYRPTVKTPAPQ